MIRTWPTVRAVAPDRLTAARLQLHHAAQLVTAVGVSYLPAAPDDSHTGFTWHGDTGLLLGEELPSGERFGLRVRALCLVQCDRGGRVTAECALEGRTVESAYDWLRQQLQALGQDPARLTATKHYAIPPSPVSTGVAFDANDAEAFDTLGRWYDIGARLARLALEESGTPGSVRVWPHHFDIAALTILSETPRRTIGVGMTPGDEWYAEPYIYVGPYPYPSFTSLPALPSGGLWHTTGWLGAVLTATALASVGAGGQERAALSFVHEARLRCAELLRGGGRLGQ